MLFFDGYVMMHLYASIIAKTYNEQVFGHRKCKMMEGDGRKFTKRYFEEGSSEKYESEKGVGDTLNFPPWNASVSLLPKTVSVIV